MKLWGEKNHCSAMVWYCYNSRVAIRRGNPMMKELDGATVNATSREGELALGLEGDV